MAIRRHRLPRFWLALTLGLVATGVGGAWWWESQLPRRLEQAARDGRLDACIRYSDQLASLRWLSGRYPEDQGRCRRAKAEQLWQQQKPEEALKLQLLLANSGAGTEADRQQLLAWQQGLKDRALTRFQQGDLEGALALLKPMGEDQRPDGSALGDNLREFWARNELQQQRATKLVAEKRWWEALEALNRIDHPWWTTATAPLRQQVDQAVAGLKSKEQEHHSHGEQPIDSVPIASLNAAVQRQLATGVDEWTAFTKACDELGGRVVESGPETTCRR
ncbi:hypothetical protein KQ304_03090 [Synechococcus sp. CS-1329]|uniref:hypothetical protein n=1 Tax=Synechococcus sp. CS-1329 TaxID=2847975 RepID=UPI00223B13E0|nr:hypothetical protein [Synechococcus sp. CS-1329]MCT0217989.1 hypothetical protein [Synechococcus sp. CS-1329]